MTKCGTLYTVGYSTLGGMEQLEAFLAGRVILIDIRYLPASRWQPEWSRKRLYERFAPNYQHIRDLGNINYHSLDLPIRLFDAKRGVSKIVQLLQQGYDICLLCTCSDWKTCHRRIVADLVRDELPDIQPVHLSKEDLCCFIVN
jgi:uncharacterized protein (DUF488 family)